jgi:hypothetical protein
MLVLGTYRDTELGRHTPLTVAVAELKRSGALDRIDVRGLPLDDVASLARSALGTAEVAAQVHARTGGNAFLSKRCCGSWPTRDRTRYRRAFATQSAYDCLG